MINYVYYGGDDDDDYDYCQGFLNIKWAKWKRVLLTRSIAIVPCVIIAILARNSLDYLDAYINVEQSLLVGVALGGRTLQDFIQDFWLGGGGGDAVCT